MNSSDVFDRYGDIAIIGLACRFPGARNIDQFWRNLRDGVESISFFSDQELIAEGVDPAMLRMPNYVKAGAILEDEDLFDASFFGVHPAEAVITDPQHRLFLEHSWEAFENAGYDPAIYKGSIGVFAGAGWNSYLLNELYPHRHLLESVNSFQAMIATEKDHLSTRVSYKLNLRGPSITVQTACSTSLVAVHLACQSLLNGECDMALAGGVSIQVPQMRGYLYQEGGILSPDGHCRAFDAEARGTVGGSGVGVVVLKRLADAMIDRDCIHAVIKGSAINNDGALKAGYTAPSIDGQAQVIKLAQALAEVEPETISYVEAHGTGTPLGDPIEIAALTKVFGESARRRQFCALGSVKTNIGHLDAAAGIAGLIKTVLAIKHRQIPASLNYRQPNPKIDFRNSPFYVNRELQAWEAKWPRRAGVSSFGIGGTNAHLIVEEAPEMEAGGPGRDYQVLTLSARTETAVAQVTSNLCEWLRNGEAQNLADVAYTLQLGRKAFDNRQVVVCQGLDEAIRKLAGQGESNSYGKEQDKRQRPVVFMFPGQEATYPRMGETLYRQEQTFREELDRCAEAAWQKLGIDLRTILYPGRHESNQQMKPISTRQPALFVVEYALARMLMRWGVEPEVMIGHGLGEYVAACLAEVFTLEEGLTLVRARERVMSEGRRVGRALREFEEELGKVMLKEPKKRYISTASGEWVRAGEATEVAYWVRQISEKPKFWEGVERLREEPERLLLEVGPGEGLSELAQSQRGMGEKLNVIAVMGKNVETESRSVAEALGQLWMMGGEVDWRKYSEGQMRRRVILPTYPFERKRYWIEPANNVMSNGLPEYQTQLSSEFSQRENILMALKDIVKELTGIDPSEIDISTNFFELGVDSLLLIQASEIIKARFRIDISLAQLFEELSTLQALAADIDQKLSANLMREVSDGNSEGEGRGDNRGQFGHW